jgi:hypothetical protein
MLTDPPTRAFFAHSVERASNFLTREWALFRSRALSVARKRRSRFFLWTGTLKRLKLRAIYRVLHASRVGLSAIRTLFRLRDKPAFFFVAWRD